MKKLIILLLSATAFASAFALGCSGGSDRTNGQHGNVDTQQEIIEDDETCPDGDCEDKPAPEPEILPRMPKKRNDKLPPVPKPLPVPAPQHRK